MEEAGRGSVGPGSAPGRAEMVSEEAGMSSDRAGRVSDEAERGTEGARRAFEGVKRTLGEGDGEGNKNK